MKVALTLLVIAMGFILAIAGSYLWLLPNVFNGSKTHSIFVVGVLSSSVSGGYIGFKCSGVSTRAMRICVALFSGLSVAAVVAYFSLLIMVNVKGS